MSTTHTIPTEILIPRGSVIHQLDEHGRATQQLTTTDDMLQLGFPRSEGDGWLYHARGNYWFWPTSIGMRTSSDCPAPNHLSPDNTKIVTVADCGWCNGQVVVR